MGIRASMKHKSTELVTSLEAARIMGMPWATFKFRVWREVKGEVIPVSTTCAVADILLMFGISWETFLTTMSGSAQGLLSEPFPMPINPSLWASKEAQYLTPDITRAARKLSYRYDRTGELIWLRRTSPIFAPPSPVIDRYGQLLKPPTPSESAPYGYAPCMYRVRFFRPEPGCPHDPCPPNIYARKHTPFVLPVEGSWSSRKALYRRADVEAMAKRISRGSYPRAPSRDILGPMGDLN